MSLRRSEKWPWWARKAFAPVLAKRRALAKAQTKQDLEADNHGYDGSYGRGRRGMSRQLLREAHHTMAPDEDEEAPLTTPRDMEIGTGEDAEPPEAKAVDDATSYRELMEYAAANKKDRDADEEVMPIPGNMYRWWGLGIVSNLKSVQNLGLLFIFAAQAFAPPACIINNLYRMDWTHWKFGVDDWNMYHGVSNFSKHVVATIFLFMFTLNGMVVIKQERIASMKISAMLEWRQTNYEGYNKDVSYFWLITGRIMNCGVVLECVVITYFSFVLSDTPMDVLFNAMAVTFLYNLDDIGGEMGFLGDEDWDGEELGKLYYWDVFDMMIELDLPDHLTPYDIHEIPQMKSKFTHWSYKIAEPLLWLLAILLPLMYIFIDNLHCKPEGVKLAVIDMKAQIAELQAMVDKLS